MTSLILIHIIMLLSVLCCKVNERFWFMHSSNHWFDVNNRRGVRLYCQGTPRHVYHCMAYVFSAYSSVRLPYLPTLFCDSLSCGAQGPHLILLLSALFIPCHLIAVSDPFWSFPHRSPLPRPFSPLYVLIVVRKPSSLLEPVLSSPFLLPMVSHRKTFLEPPPLPCYLSTELSCVVSLCGLAYFVDVGIRGFWC